MNLLDLSGHVTSASSDALPIEQAMCHVRRRLSSGPRRKQAPDYIALFLINAERIASESTRRSGAVVAPSASSAPLGYFRVTLDVT
jgi:hypothetical protein